jgi:hypothetical protein
MWRAARSTDPRARARCTRPGHARPLFVDRYGWFRLPKREISRLRFGGVVLLLVGVALIRVF